MGSANTEAIETLLGETERAHGAYETTELNGVYDQEWPRWYAAYAVEHGIDDLVGRPVTTDELAQFLAERYAEYERADPKPAEPWAAFIAQRIATDL